MKTQQTQIIELEKQLSQLEDKYKNISRLLSQSAVGLYFMTFETKALEWNKTTNKNKAVEQTLKNLKVSEVNEAMLNQHHTTRERFIGRTVEEIFTIDLDAGRNIVRQVFDKGTHTSKTKKSNAQGESMIVTCNYICFYNANKAIEGLLCAQTENSEDVSFERTYETLYKNAPIAYQSLNAEGQIIRVNKKWCSETGYEEYEVIGKAFANFLTEKDRIKQAKLFRTLKEKGEIKHVQFDIITKSGEIIQTHYEANVSKDTYGKFLFTNCIFKNITDEIKAQQKLESEKNNFKNIFNATDSYLFILDEKKNIININKAVIEKTKYNKEELLGKSIISIHDSAQTDQLKALLKTLPQGQQHCQIPIRSKDNVLIQVETYIIQGKWDNKMAFFMVSKDISDIKSSEQKFSKAFELNPNITGISDLESGEYQEVNSAFYTTFKLSKADVIGKKAEEVITIDKDLRKRTLVKLKKDGEVRNIATKLKAHNGITIDAMMSAAIIEIDGKSYNYTSVRDITQEREIERQLIKAKEAAENREKELRLLFDNMVQGFALHKIIQNEKHEAIDYSYVTMNKAFEKLTKLKANNCIGNTVLEILPETEDYWIKNYAKVATTGQAIEFENYSRAIDKYFNVVAYCPKKGYFATIVTDVTERRKNKEALHLANEELKRAQEISHTGSWFLDIKSNKVRWSDELYKIFGLDHKESAPNYNEQSRLFTPESWQQLQHALDKTIETGTPYELELKTIKNDGSKGWLWSKGEEVKNSKGETIGVWGASQDITKQKEFELELKEAKNKAEIANIYKNEFLANMSHEIRTPMNGVIGFASLLRNNKLSEVKRNHYLDIVDSNSKQLLNLINDIIDIAKIEAGEFSIQKKRCPLKQILKETESTFWSIQKEKKKFNVKITAKLPAGLDHLTLVSDESRLKQVLFNLIGNALKFTTNGEINFGYELKDDTSILFYVKDTGLGMPKDELNNIFKRFRQIQHKQQTLYRGTGLGLAISKGIIEIMGGKIWVESEAGVGSQFYFTLPLEEIEMPQAQKPSVEVKPKQIGKNKTILIAEDEEVIQLFFRELLDSKDLKIRFANNGQEAVDIYRNNPDIQLVLMDIRMPIMGGEEAAQKILKENPKAKIIAQTAFAMHGDEKRFLQQGFVDYIAKPIDARLIKEKISLHIED